MPAGPEAICLLSAAAGHARSCSGPACPYWEQGGAVVPAGCALKRLGIELAGRPELVRRLLELQRGDPVQAISTVYRLADGEDEA